MCLFLISFRIIGLVTKKVNHIALIIRLRDLLCEVEFIWEVCFLSKVRGFFNVAP
jgi:hypothetical protein